MCCLSVFFPRESVITPAEPPAPLEFGCIADGLSVNSGLLNSLLDLGRPSVLFAFPFIRFSMSTCRFIVTRLFNCDTSPSSDDLVAEISKMSVSRCVPLASSILFSSIELRKSGCDVSELNTPSVLFEFPFASRLGDKSTLPLVLLGLRNLSSTWFFTFMDFPKVRIFDNESLDDTSGRRSDDFTSFEFTSVSCASSSESFPVTISLSSRLGKTLSISPCRAFVRLSILKLIGEKLSPLESLSLFFASL